MSGQSVTNLLSIALTINDEFWIHPFTGVLLFSHNDSKLSIHNKVALFDQLPPDMILELPFGKITTISFNLSFFVIGFSSGDITLVDNQSYNLTHLKKLHNKSILNLNLNTDNTLIMIWEGEDKFFIYDLQKEKIIKEYKVKNEIFTCFEWLTSTKFVYATNKGSIHYWDINSNKEIKLIEKAHEDSIIRIVKHPRSLYTIVTCEVQGEIKIWDLDENKIYPDLVNSFIEKRSEITDIATSPLGEFVYVSKSDGLIRIYDMRIPRGEKLFFFLNTKEKIRQIISSNQIGEFLVIHENGSIKLFQGFNIDNINLECQNFQDEMENFMKKLDQLPQWLSENGLEIILPEEIPLIEKNLDLATRLLTPSLLEKSDSPWMRDYFKESFKKFILLEDRILQIIEETKTNVQKEKETIIKTSDLSKKLEQEIIQYLSNQKGKLSLDQISLYFNTSIDNILPIIQKLEREKMINGNLTSEYSGYFLELNENKIESNSINSKDTNIITCHNCGTDYDIVNRKCPNCKTACIYCDSCSKPIQKRQMIINCPHCKTYFHMACFEQKVKLFGRCSKCHESVDFDSLLKKTVEEQKQQDNVVSGLNRLISKQASFLKQRENKDEDDDLFDF